MITEISKVIFFGESKIQLRTSRGTPWLAEITPHGAAVSLLGKVKWVRQKFGTFRGRFQNYFLDDVGTGFCQYKFIK